MIERLISFSLNNRLLIVCLLVALILGGMACFLSLPMDSYPDVSNVQVQIITEPEAMATEEVESLVTLPIETAMSGLQGLSLIRSNSSFGMSVVTVIFKDNVDVYFARQLVQQRLNSIALPEEVPHPQLGPVVSSFSNVFMYYLTGSDDLIKLRTLQDWVVARQLRTVPGVGNIVSYGGFVKQYQVLISPAKLAAYKLTVRDVADAIKNNNLNAGGNFIEQGGEEIIIRGIGRLTGLEDIGHIVLCQHNGIPVTVSQVAEIKIDGAFRRGSGSMDGKGEAVTGMVLTRKGANTKVVVQDVERAIEKLQKTLPEGIKIVPYYNQMELVDKTMETVREIILFSGSLVLIVLAAILLNIRAAVIAAIIIPLSLLFSFVLMKFAGLSSNLMTLGAVDFGVIVDAGVVMVENVFRHLSEAYEKKEKQSAAELLKIITTAAQEVGRPIVFAIVIIIAVYIPLFSLEGIEGKMFAPLALTFVFALVGALVSALTIIPVLCYWGFRGKIIERESPVLAVPNRYYVPALKMALSRPVPVIGAAVIALLLSLLLLPFLGSEFMPTLDEGSILLRTKLAPSVAHTQSMEISTIVEKIICSHPQVEHAVSHIGRSGMGSDLDGVDNADIYIGLKPKSEWQGKTKAELVEDMSKELDVIPGLVYSFSQPIGDMVDDLVSGVKADVAVKVYGEDLKTIDGIATQIQHILKGVKGAADLQREHILGLPQLNVRLNRSAIARYGLNVSTVQEDIQTAFAGRVVTQVFEGSKRFGVLLRFPPNKRETEEDIQNMIVSTPSGARVPLKALADIAVESGTVMVNRENGQRRTAVLANIRGRDLGSFVQEAMSKVDKQVEIPRGYSIVWGGQYENQQHAMERLNIVVPCVLLLIFILLFAAFNSFKNAALVMLNVPFAIIGGIVALWLSAQPMSVPAIIGFIALFGVAVQNGVILISYIAQLQNKGMHIDDAIIEGAKVRLRPVFMTAAVAIMGLLPKIFSTNTGAEVQRPLATVVLGGLLSATLLTLLVLPVMFKLAHKNSGQKPPAGDSDGDEAEGDDTNSLNDLGAKSAADIRFTADDISQALGKIVTSQSAIEEPSPPAVKVE